MSTVGYLVPEPRAPAPQSSPPSIAIAIACYQAAATIPAALASALSQTVPAHEVIVCDDGSTDDLDRSIAPYRDRIVLLRKENGGAASARNHAIRTATADFVAILDADDTYEPRRLEAIARLAALRPDLDLVTTDAYVERDGIRIGRLFELNPFDVDDQRVAILHTSFVGGWPAIRRERFLELGGFDESLRIAEDWDMWLRLIFSGSLAGAVDEPLMTYRRHPLGLTGDSRTSHRAGIAMLERSRATPGLRPNERTKLEASIGRKRKRLAVEEIGAAIDEHVSGAALIRLSLSPDVPFRARLAACKAALRRG